MSFISDELIRLAKSGEKDVNVIMGVIHANLIKEVVEVSAEANNEVITIGKAAVEKYKAQVK